MLRNLIKKIAPRLAFEMEQESQQWMIQCPTCGNEKSVWEAGGTRYKGYGTKRTLGKCSTCNKMRWLRIYKPG